jgi:hypothetical protein
MTKDAFYTEFEFGDDDSSYDGIEFECAEDLPPIPPKLADISAKNIDENFFIVNMGGKARIMRWGKSSLDPTARVPEFMSFADCSNLLRNKFKIIKPEAGSKKKKPDRIPLFKYWADHESRYTFDGVVFDSKLPRFEPSLEQDAINLWRGFAVQENDSASWDLMEKHIREILADGDKDSGEYILNWTAAGLQSPTDPIGVAMHFYSLARGAGKGTFGHALKRIYGPLHGLYVTQPSHLVGKFNAHLAQTGFLFLDEALFPGFKEHQNTLKTLITEETLMIEKKGVDPYPMRNALKIVTASNEKWIVSAAEDERRHAMFEVSDSKKQNREYFGALRRQMYEEGGLGRMLFDLRRRNVKGWNPEKEIPKTSLLHDNKRVSADPELIWFGDILNEGTLPRAKDYNPLSRPLSPHVVPAGVLYDHGRKRPGLAHMSDYDFAEFIKKWGATRKRTMQGSYWQFPPLADVRREWQKAFPWWGAFDASVRKWAASGEDL